MKNESPPSTNAPRFFLVIIRRLLALWWVFIVAVAGNVVQVLGTHEGFGSSFLSSLLTLIQQLNPILAAGLALLVFALLSWLTYLAWTYRGAEVEGGHLALGLESATYERKLTALADTITKLSKEMDEVLAQAAQATTERQEKLKNVETQLRALTARETELKHEIEVMETTTPEAAHYFLDMMVSLNRKDKLTAWFREAVWFVAGVLATVLINILTARVLH